MVSYKEIANEIRKQVLTLVHKAGTSHIASNFSCVDIATVLYENLKPQDRVVWSKGWVAALIYVVLNKQGILTDEELAQFPNDPYFGLAETKVKGVEVSGGAMGHGLPVAVGIALGKQRAKEDGVIYCIMSDGEMNEGTTWESALVAGHHKLDNLVIFIDINKWQAMGRTKDVLDLEPLDKKWEAFNWEVRRVDGHNYEQVEKALLEPGQGKPLVILCDTVKGKGVSFFEDHLLYHYKHVDKTEYKKAMEELNA